MGRGFLRSSSICSVKAMGAQEARELAHYHLPWLGLYSELRRIRDIYGVTDHPKTADGLVHYARARLGAPYWRGAYGQVATLCHSSYPAISVVRGDGSIISNANPMVTQIWGKIVSTTQKIEHEVESAWGAPQIEYTTRTLRAWDVVGCSPEPMEWDDDSTITIAEFKDCLARRETQKAEAKARQEARQSKDSAGFPAAGSENKSASPTADADFKF